MKKTINVCVWMRLDDDFKFQCILKTIQTMHTNIKWSWPKLTKRENSFYEFFKEFTKLCFPSLTRATIIIFFLFFTFLRLVSTCSVSSHLHLGKTRKIMENHGNAAEKFKIRLINNILLAFISLNKRVIIRPEKLQSWIRLLVMSLDHDDDYHNSVMLMQENRPHNAFENWMNKNVKIEMSIW